MAEITREEMRERLGNIDQIRDIIFGPQLREYSNRLDELESSVSKLQLEIREQVEQMRTAFSTELRTEVESIEKKIKTLTVNTQEDSTDIRQQLDRTSKRLSNNIDTLNDIVDKHHASVRNDLLETKEKFQDDVRQLREHLFEELERRFSMLREMKVSRDDMAEFLFELGMRIKGAEFVPELKKAADSDLYTNIIVQED